MYCYIETDLGLWAVGFYGPDSIWHVITNYRIKLDAIEAVQYLNGEIGRRL